MQYSQQTVTDNSSSPRQLVEWMREQKLLLPSPACPKCHSPMHLQPSAAFLGDGVCNRCTRCYTRRSVRVGSFFEGSRHLPLVKQLRLLVAFEAKSSTKSTANQWEVSRQTVSNYWAELRGLISSEADRMDTMGELEFSGSTVEVDCITFKNIVDSSTGARLDVIHVQGIMEPTSGVLGFHFSPDQTAANLRPHISRLVPAGTIIFTDEHKSYGTLNRDGYHHYSVNHNQRDYAHDDVGPDGERLTVTTNHLESVWAGVRPMVRNRKHYNTARLAVALKQAIFAHTDGTIWDLIHV
jgi:hypothetical protein